MKFFVDPTLYPDAEGAARRAAARFRHRFGIGPDAFNERFPRAEREGIVAFLQGHADAPPQTVAERQPMTHVATPATSSPERGSSSVRSTQAAIPVVEHGRPERQPATSSPERGSSSARSTQAASIVEHGRPDEPPANDAFDAVEASFEEVLEPDDVVMVASLGVEGVVVAVTGTTVTVALDGVTDEFDVSDLAPPAAQVADAPPAAPEAALASPSSVEPRVVPELPSSASQTSPSSGQAVEPSPTVGV